ncbi:MAG: hypothetical protein ACRDP7_37150 [Trebonia sp.]
MRSAPSALLPILRSQVAGNLLALLYLHPEDEYSLTEAAGAIGANLPAVHYEVSKLSEGDSELQRIPASREQADRKPRLVCALATMEALDCANGHSSRLGYLAGSTGR